MTEKHTPDQPNRMKKILSITILVCATIVLAVIIAGIVISAF